MLDPNTLTQYSGIMTYVVLNGLTYIIKLISFGRVIPADEDLKEYWSCKFKPVSRNLLPF